MYKVKRFSWFSSSKTEFNVDEFNKDGFFDSAELNGSELILKYSKTKESDHKKLKKILDSLRRDKGIRKITITFIDPTSPKGYETFIIQ